MDSAPKASKASALGIAFMIGRIEFAAIIMCVCGLTYYLSYYLCYISSLSCGFCC